MNASLKALLNEQYKLVAELREENKNLKEKLSEITMVADDEKQSIEHILELEEENRDLVEKIEKLLWEKIKLEEEIRSLELENRAMKVESEDLKMWLREKLPLALLKEYMEKFE